MPLLHRRPKIVTPVGTVTLANYSRHAFSYEVPALEANDGAAIAMIVLNGEMLNLSLGAPPGNGGTEVEVWHRCQAQTNFGPLRALRKVVQSP